MSKLKLTYFDMTGRAEPIRQALFIGGIDFEDERLGWEEFGKLKDKYPYGSLPVLTLENGEIIAQSNVILRYIGRQTKLYPQDNLQATKVDELIEATEDVFFKIFPILFEQNEEIKKQGIEKNDKEVIPHWVKLFEKRIEKYGKGGYAVGDQLTIADLKINQLFGGILHGTLEQLKVYSSESIKNAPRIMEIINTVSQNPKIVEWNKKHQI
eukprot:TRINITY_DN95_c0_g1_i7.p1 TRINITY_DN95_c0_g1~~TRINITY_DN95_c0_g1_i7.p1  ORF type:complete len:241 (+),score=72.48 TRINITY_DN95_c0_g1_i7:91-723(+)